MVRTFVDTNVWVYASDRGDPRSEPAKRSIAEVPPHDIVVSTQVELELFDVLTRDRRGVRPLTGDEAASVVSFLDGFTVVGADAALVAAAIDTHRATGFRIWDAMIVEAAVRAGCERLLTEDLSHGQVVRGVEIADPFVDE